MENIIGRYLSEKRGPCEIWIQSESNSCLFVHWERMNQTPIWLIINRLTRVFKERCVWMLLCVCVHVGRTKIWKCSQGHKQTSEGLNVYFSHEIDHTDTRGALTHLPAPFIPSLSPSVSLWFSNECSYNSTQTVQLHFFFTFNFVLMCVLCVTRTHGLFVSLSLLWP